MPADTASPDTAYAHMGLDPAPTRHYRVSAINAEGTSDASDSDDTTTASTNTAATGAGREPDGPSRRLKTADLYRPNARFIPERQRYQVLTPFGKLGYSHDS